MNKNKTLSHLASILIVLSMLFCNVPFMARAEEVKEPGVKITDYTKPEGELGVGQYFVIQGKITSEEPMKKIVTGIYYRNGVANQEIVSEINDTEFDMKTVDESLVFGILPEGLYCYQVGVTDSHNNYIRLVYSEFQVGKPDTESEIRTENTSFPSETMEYGRSFKINCDIISVQPLYKVCAYIYNSDDSEIWKTAKYFINDKKYTFSGDDVFDIAELDAGSYTYKLIAEDYSGYNVTLTRTQFEVKKTTYSDTDSEIKVSGVEVPSGVLQHGTFFNLRGNITSKHKLKVVTAKIVQRKDNTAVQERNFAPNSTEFNFYPDIDYSMIFESLSTGEYTFIIDAEDEKGYSANLVKSDFKIGDSNIKAGDVNIDGKIDIADVVAMSGYVADPENNFLQPVGIANGDVHNKGDGLTTGDVLKIQQYISSIIESLD